MKKRRAAWVAAGAFVVMAGAQIAIPLTDERAGLTSLVVGAFALTTTALCARVWGWRRAAAVAGGVVASGLVVEMLGTATGWPFGNYQYTESLQPQLNGVPVAVALAWWAMGLPAREVASRVTDSPVLRVFVGAVALTAWDVMLDPQMVEEGYWAWEGGGVWREVPLTNYAGWLLVSALLMMALDRLLPEGGRSWLLAGLYGWWAVMSALGFIAFFGDPLVGLVGGAIMIPLAAKAFRWRGLRWARKLG